MADPAATNHLIYSSGTPANLTLVYLHGTKLPLLTNQAGSSLPGNCRILLKILMPGRSRLDWRPTGLINEVATGQAEAAELLDWLLPPLWHLCRWYKYLAPPVAPLPGCWLVSQCPVWSAYPAMFSITGCTLGEEQKLHTTKDNSRSTNLNKIENIQNTVQTFEIIWNLTISVRRRGLWPSLVDLCCILMLSSNIIISLS